MSGEVEAHVVPTGNDRAVHVRRIDHVVIEAGDQEQLFVMFAEVLGLPEAWPLAQWGAIHEGGVCAGTCNIGCNHPSDPNSDPAPTVRAVGLEPAADLEEVVAGLRYRGLEATDPIVTGELDLPATGGYEPWRQGFTNVIVFGGPARPVPFVCHYHHDVRVRAAEQRARFDAAGGGPLGLTGLDALAVHTADVERELAAWEQVLADARREGDALFLSEGPALRFGAGAGSPALVFGVRSLDDAVAALKAGGIGFELDGDVRLDAGATLGLEIRLEPAG